MRILLFIFSALTVSTVFAQEFTADKLGNVDINVMSRAEMQFPENGTNALKLNLARLEMKGKVASNLEFRLRMRVKSAKGNGSLDGSTGNLDHASLTYKFGEDNRWSLLVGKTANNFGSFEFYNNPTYEYGYSEAVGGYTNLFMVGAKLGYDVAPGHNVSVQVYNTQNNKFESTFAGNANGLKAAETPLGLNFTWMGNFLDKKFKTFWSLGTSTYADGKRNVQVALGNNFKVGGLNIYLDLLSSNFAFDHTSLSRNVYSKVYGDSKFGEDVTYRTAVARLDYMLTPNFYATGKVWLEGASGKDSALGDNFRKNSGYVIGLEYKPVASQNFKLFAYYSGTDKSYGTNIGIPDASGGLFSLGGLFVANVL